MVNIEQKKVNSEPNNVYFSFYPHFLEFMIAYLAHLQKPVFDFNKNQNNPSADGFSSSSLHAEVMHCA